MCYNISYTIKKAEEYTQRYGHLPEAKWEQYLQIHPPQNQYFLSGFNHPSLPVICKSGIISMQWGLIPSWTKSLAQATKIQNSTLNAVGETCHEKPSFRNPIKNQRGILPVTGFFEWRTINTTKYPYYIYPADQPFFSFGCIYDIWKHPNSEQSLYTVSIITTVANNLMEIIHNEKKRMPLILSPSDEKTWLNPATNNHDLTNLIRPTTEIPMSAYTISKLAGNAKANRNILEILQKAQYAGIQCFS